MKSFSIVKTFIILLILMTVTFTLSGQTLALTVTAVPSSNIVSETGHYAVMFTTGTTGTVKTVEMTYPAGFNLSGVKLVEVSGLNSGVLSVSGLTLTYTVTSEVSVPSGQEIRIIAGGIKNGTSIVAITISVTTKNASSGVIEGPAASNAFILTKVYAAMLGSDVVVNSARIVDGSIATVDLADGAVTGPKIAPAAVGPSQLSNDSIWSTHILNGTITTGDLSFDPATQAELDTHKLSADHDGRYFTESELSTGGIINSITNPVDWTKLKGVPSGFADGVDDTGSGPASDVVCTGCVSSTDIADGGIGNIDMAPGSYPNITGVGALGSLSVSGGANLATASGNVGVGTSSLYQKLTVNGTIGFKDGTTPLLMNSEGCCSAGNRMIWAHSPSYPDWGIKYNDSFDEMYWQTGSGSEFLTVDFALSRVGIGTTSPLSRLHIYSPDNPTVLRLHSSASPGAGRIEFWSDPEGSVNLWRPGFIQSTDAGSFTGGLVFYTNGTGSANKTGSLEVMRLTNGNVGIGTSAPLEKLHVAGNFLRVDGAGAEGAYMGGDGWGGDVQIGSTNSAVTSVALYNRGSGSYMHLYVGALHIMGGADLAEPFQSVDAEEIMPGMVVAIDPANPGQLKVAEKAYDKTVAGIVSGANGINPGVTMMQEGSEADGTIQVALTGRVYAWVDAAYGEVEPGDLLTTSDTPGHAMKVNDYASAHGTIIGKAMTALKDGKGLVLVLVSLQ